jgi:hypothetical protein
VKLLVYLRDGRTVYALIGRGQLRDLTSEKRGPGHEDEPVIVVRGTWHPGLRAFEWQPNVRVRWIARGSISHVEEGDPNQAAGGGAA